MTDGNSQTPRADWKPKHSPRRARREGRRCCLKNIAYSSLSPNPSCSSCSSWFASFPAN